jgi:hypothetical protein
MRRIPGEQRRHLVILAVGLGAGQGEAAEQAAHAPPDQRHRQRRSLTNLGQAGLHDRRVLPQRPRPVIEAHRDEVKPARKEPVENALLRQDVVAEGEAMAAWEPLHADQRAAQGGMPGRRCRRRRRAVPAEHPSGSTREAPDLVGRGRGIGVDAGADPGGPAVAGDRQLRLAQPRRVGGGDCLAGRDLGGRATVAQIQRDGPLGDQREAPRDAAQHGSRSPELRLEDESGGEHIGAIDHEQRSRSASRLHRGRQGRGRTPIGQTRQEPHETESVQHGRFGGRGHHAAPASSRMPPSPGIRQ